MAEIVLGGVRGVRVDGFFVIIDPTGEADKEDGLKALLGTENYATHYQDEEQIVWLNVLTGEVDIFNHATGEWAELGGGEE